MVLRTFYPVCLGLLLWTGAARGETAEEQWAKILQLDAGPRSTATTGEQIRGAVQAHLEEQEAALRSFIVLYPSDSHAFEARLRLARLLQLRSELVGTPKALEEAARILEQLDQISPAALKVEVEFSKLSLLMRRSRQPTPEKREELLNAARKFYKNHPEDRRVPALLVEIGTLFQGQPKTWRWLLQTAEPLAKGDELKARIADDFKRLEVLGQVLSLPLTGLDGKPIELAETRGSVVAVVFFALWSPPAMEALEKIQKALGEFPPGKLRVVAVSLDAKPSEVATRLKEKLEKSRGATGWLVSCDGQGWESSAIRSLGVNALPTVWLLDRKGRVRSLIGLDSITGQIRQLLAER